MNVAAEVLRFAELAARTGLEPELARRLDADPEAVLREFGLSAREAESVVDGGPGVEILSGVGAEARARWCVCWAPGPVAGISE
ncbi:hypothetical protein ABT186_10005 [Streptomyces sp. NPDC001634]|uniref:hypothetical protein n=1 Tax=Streptomyces sp. NPDC001634 TaxID=3154390 RepID=UPI00332F1369